MTFRSIRSRLALSFAGIALVAALALGALLLVILKNFYSNLEMEYLRQNAEVIGGVVSQMSTNRTPPQDVQLQIQNLAFLTQTRVQIYNQDNVLLYDSGSPAKFSVRLGVIGFSQSAPVPGQRIGGASVIAIAPEGAPAVVNPPSLSTGGDEPRNKVFFYSQVQADGSPFGFALNADDPERGTRSRLDVRLVIKRQDGLLSVRLSEGPAYGSAVLGSVAWGWALASALAVLLAAVLGSYVSKRISAPVQELTNVTARMARGDLSSRAAVNSRDELGQLAGSFNEMADQVETTVTTLRRFVSDAAHELRTPLTALRTNLDLALDENNTSQRLEFLAHAQLMVKRLEELNANLLDLSRLEAHGSAAADTLVDLARLLGERSELYASQAEQAGLSFEMELPEEPLQVHADASQLSRLMDNLVDNACKFTPQGGTVRVALRQEKDQAVFSVTDTGIGIPPDDLAQLFNRFHRGRNANTYPGSGLGLAIVRAIASANVAVVEGKSAGEGAGSQFTVRFTKVASSEQGGTER